MRWSFIFSPSFCTLFWNWLLWNAWGPIFNFYERVALQQQQISLFLSTWSCAFPFWTVDDVLNYWLLLINFCLLLADNAELHFIKKGSLWKSNIDQSIIWSNCYLRSATISACSLEILLYCQILLLVPTIWDLKTIHISRIESSISPSAFIVCIGPSMFCFSLRRWKDVCFSSILFIRLKKMQ